MVSAVVWAERTSTFADASLALLFWFRNDGIAIAARMPMIRMTTRSSIRVKPPSSFERWRSRYSTLILLGINHRAPAPRPIAFDGDTSRVRRPEGRFARAAGFVTHLEGELPWHL